MISSPSGPLLCDRCRGGLRIGGYLGGFRWCNHSLSPTPLPPTIISLRLDCFPSHLSGAVLRCSRAESGDRTYFFLGAISILQREKYCLVIRMYLTTGEILNTRILNTRILNTRMNLNKLDIFLFFYEPF